MFGRILLSLALLTGCRSEKSSAPTAPGTSIELTYPVVLIGQGSLNVREDELTLTTTTMASGLNFLERLIVDSSGAIYDVKAPAAVDPSSPWWRDMGTSHQAFFLELEKRPNATLEDVKRLVLDELASPHGVWQGNANAVAKVKGFASAAELIAACRTSWDWNN